MGAVWRGRPLGICIALAAGIGLLGAGCGSDDSSGDAAQGGDKPAEVTVPFIVNVTGQSAVFGKKAQQGADLAVEQANSAGVLGSTKIKLDVKDDGTVPRQAISLMTQAAKSDAPMVLYGVNGADALAIAPIAGRSKVPLVGIQSGGAGFVESGDTVFRATAPQSSYTDHVGKYLQQKGIKRVAMIYDADNATIATLAKTVYPDLAKTYGFDIVKSSGVQQADTDLSSVLSGLLSTKPEAVLMLVVGPQNSNAASILSRSGYDGLIVAQTGIGLDVLKALGKTADGIIYPTDFSSQVTSGSGAEFVKAFKEKYGDEPDSLSASGYDGARLMIEGFKNAPDYTREGLLAGLEKAAQAGFDGAAGKFTFENRDARVPGLLVEWRNGAEHIIEGD
jgi:branched-chain amino acid transport system substrate-binding protein